MKVFITRPIPDKYYYIFEKQNIHIDVYEKDEVCPRPVLLRRVKGVDGVIAQWEDYIDKEFFEAAGKQLKIVANFATGCDRIDLKEAAKRGVIITNTPTKSLHYATAEGAIGFLLSTAKRVTKLYIQTKESNIPEYSPIGEMGVSVRNKVTGIVGLGNIGSKVAEMMHDGFKNKILYFGRTRKKQYEEKLQARKVSLERLFSDSDFVFITLPSNQDTAKLVTKKILQKMKPQSIFISISSNNIFDEESLMRLLKERRIYGVGLDIYSNRVKPIESNNLLLTSHMINMEYDTTSEMAKLCVENVARVLTGKSPISPVQ